MLSKPTYLEEWTIDDLLRIEDKQVILTLLSADKDKWKDNKDKEAVLNFERL